MKFRVMFQRNSSINVVTSSRKGNHNYLKVQFPCIAPEVAVITADNEQEQRFTNRHDRTPISRLNINEKKKLETRTSLKTYIVESIETHV